MAGLAHIHIIGHLGRDPETRKVGDGTVCSFNLAVSSRVKGADKTTWFRVDVWNKQGESCQEFLAKGRQVSVIGDLSTREYDKDGKTITSLEVRASQVTFLGKPDDAGAARTESKPATGGRTATKRQAEAPPGSLDDLDDSALPF